MRNAGLEEAQAGIKISGRNINNLKNADDTTLLAESEEEIKSLLMKVKEESEKVGLKLTQDEALLSCPNSSGTLQLESEMERNPEVPASTREDRKSTRLNSSH